MKNLFLIILVMILGTSCTRDKNTSSNPGNYIPDSYSYVIASPLLREFLQEMDSIKLFEKNDFLIPSRFRTQILQFISRDPSTQSSILSLKQEGNGDNIFLFINPTPIKPLSVDTISNSSMETFTYDKFQITKYTINNFSTFTTEKDGMFFASNSRAELEKINKGEFAPLIDQPEFNKTFVARDNSKTSILIKDKTHQGWVSEFFSFIDLPFTSPNLWSILEMENEGEKIKLNGIITWHQDRSIFQIFRNVGAQQNQIAKVSPVGALGFYSFTYNDYDLFIENLNQYRDSITEIPPGHLLTYSLEAGLILYPKEDLLVIRTTDPGLAGESLLITRELVKEFREVPIYQSKDVIDISNYFYPLLPDKKWSYYIWLEDFIIFSNNVSSLENIVSNYLNNTTLHEQPYYAQTMENLAGSSSLLLVSHNQKENIDPTNSTEMILDLSSYPVVALQWVVEKDFAHIHGVLNPETQGSSPGSAIEQMASINLDSPPAIAPYPVKNRINGDVEILVQDDENMLYRYGINGDRIWKKSFAHRIKGAIHQVDFLKRGYYQYVFTTPYALHAIDRNGNAIKPFPVEFRDEITQPLSVFDYDNNNTYRFVITQGNNILLYDHRGRLVQGFDFERTSSPISQAPKHIRINNKDYILVPEENGTLNVLSRQGKSRITVKDKVEFSENKWYPYKGDFISANSSGSLVHINEDGQQDLKRVPANGNLKLVVQDDVLVTLNENILTINNKQITLDYGLYSQPSIFSENGNIFIAVTDTQAHRVYIFRDNGDLIPGFPVYGTGEVNMIATQANSYIFSVPGSGNEIIVYRFGN